MNISVELTREVIRCNPEPVEPQRGLSGAVAEFTGRVRATENGQPIAALEYEAYDPMAVMVIRQILESLTEQHPCDAALVIHRIGVVPVGEAAIYIAVAARHRAAAFALITAFMDQLKQEVPIWKTKTVPATMVGYDVRSLHLSCSDKLGKKLEAPHVVTYQMISLEAARAEIELRCQPLPAVRLALEEATGRVLRETVCATEDLPDSDKSTRDGFAVLRNDTSETFRIVDTLHAADWKPRQLQRGEAVRVATGSSLPCEGLRVVMQEHVERNGDAIHIVRHEEATNVRLRGEDVKAGQPLVKSGTRLGGGALALLATAGCAAALVSPRLRVLHFTTGDEIISPDMKPKPGQIRDSNSFLIRGLLRPWTSEVEHAHLREDFAVAQLEIVNRISEIENAQVLLVSGGASVGEKDFTRALLESLGFEIVFTQVNIRPGKPLIFGVNGSRIAFGLPGNPLSHFVCFHAFVAAALARLTGETIPQFQRTQLGVELGDASSARETLWPAKWIQVGQAFQPAGSGDFPVARSATGNTDAMNTGLVSPVHRQAGKPALRPLAWASSGDVTCLAETQALIRVPANCERLAAGALVEFLPAEW